MTDDRTGTDGSLPPGKIRTVVTHLEMTARPLRRPLPRPAEKLAFLHAERPTVSFYRYLYNTVGEPWLWADRRRLDDDALASIVHDPKVEVYVLYVAGVPAGFAELDRRAPPGVDLTCFGLVPEFIGRRLGPLLLDWALGEAWLGETERVTVRTCTLDHPRAFTVCQRAGFVPVRQETRLLDDPRALGLIPAHVRNAGADGPLGP